MNDEEQDLDSAYSDGEGQHLSLGEQLGLWGAMLWIMVATLIGTVMMLSWLWRLIGRVLP